ncbi:hypothetical protein L1887_11343 [Cichorium endivia]|nr:hypothetical protein L1887_11343 [Cichorium endivia]
MVSPENTNWIHNYDLVDDIPVPVRSFVTPAPGSMWPMQTTFNGSSSNPGYLMHMASNLDDLTSQVTITHRCCLLLVNTGVSDLVMSTPVLLVSLLLLMILTSQFEWNQHIVNEVEARPLALSQKHQYVLQREESIKEKCFYAMGLQEKVLRGFYVYRFENPYAIQQRGIVPFCKGLDVIQQPQSGTEKTATFLLWYLQQLDYKVYACVGGTSARQDLRILSAGVHVVVGTPGRVFDILSRQSLRADYIKMFVFDEVDLKRFKDQVDSYLPSPLIVKKKRTLKVPEE